MTIDFDAITERMIEAGGFKNHSALAKDLGITPQGLSNYKRRGGFSAQLVIEFAGKHGLSVDRLLGLPAVCEGKELPAGVNLVIDGLSTEEGALIIKALNVLRTPGGLGEVFRHSLNALATPETNHV